MDSMSRGSRPSTKRERWRSMMKQAGSPPHVTPQPYVPSSATTSQTTNANTPKPQVLRGPAYCSWTSIGEAMGGHGSTPSIHRPRPLIVAPASLHST